MAVVEIKKFNEPILRRKCSGGQKIDREIKDIIVDMAQTMEKESGFGLAAPQVGISKRIIVIRTDSGGRRILVLINPKIISKSKEIEELEEGCLSFPSIFLKIKRPKKVEVKGTDINGREVIFNADGIFARVLQHEVDHLDGILFFSRLKFFPKIKFLLKHPLIKL